MNNLHVSHGGLRSSVGWNCLQARDWSVWNDADWCNSFEYVMGGADCAIILSTENATAIFIQPVINLNVHYRNVACGVIIIVGAVGVRIVCIFIDPLKCFNFVEHNERMSFMRLSGAYLSGTPPPKMVNPRQFAKRPTQESSCGRSFYCLGLVKEQL
jgi:hypothetical protein